MATTSIGGSRGDRVAGAALERFQDAVFVRDDLPFYFGNDGDFKLEYDEDGDNVLRTSGADLRLSDTQQLQFGDDGDCQMVYCPTNKCLRTFRKIGSYNYLIDQGVGQTENQEFLGSFSLIGSNLLFSSSGIMRATRTGSGGFAVIQGVGGGLRGTTSATSGDDVAFGDGDATGWGHAWNISKYPTFHVDFGFSVAADLAAVHHFIGLYSDASSVIGLDYDTDVSDVAYFVCTDDAGTTKAVLGALDSDVEYELDFRIFDSDDKLKGILKADGVTQKEFIISDNITTSDLGLYALCKTRTTSAKHLDIHHLKVIQNH